MRLGEQENEVSLATPPCKLDELSAAPRAFPGESALVIENQRETTAAPGTVQQAATCWRTGVKANSVLFILLALIMLPWKTNKQAITQRTAISGIHFDLRDVLRTTFE